MNHIAFPSSSLGCAVVQVLSGDVGVGSLVLLAVGHVAVHPKHSQLWGSRGCASPFSSFWKFQSP